MRTAGEARLGQVAPAAEPLSAPMREFLAWVAFRPRSHADVIEAWQSHCPRYTVWEDALAAGLVEIDAGRRSTGSARVRLTARGQRRLNGR